MLWTVHDNANKQGKEGKTYRELQKYKINNFINNPRLLYFFRRVKSTINLSHSYFIYLTRWFAINSEMNAISFVYIHGHLLYDWEYLLNLLLLTPHLLTIQSYSLSMVCWLVLDHFVCNIHVNRYFLMRAKSRDGNFIMKNKNLNQFYIIVIWNI